MNADLPKQYLALGQQSVIEHTLQRLCGCDQVQKLVVGVARNDCHWPALEFTDPKLVGAVRAGAERVDTVENCLQFIVDQGGGAEWALVHDAARPCVRRTDIERLIDAVSADSEGGILAVPLNDTIKRSRQGRDPGTILETVPRDDLWRAMTPQLFRVGELLSAIRQARTTGMCLTDEASAMEAVGRHPLLVPCAPDNIKITLPQDIQFAEMILLAQKEGTL